MTTLIRDASGSTKTIMSLDDLVQYFNAALEKVPQNTSLRSYLSDDFGGTALDATKWDVYDGGLPANPTTQGGLQLTQAAMGSLITGITHSVANSKLTINFGTTPNAEKWFVSKLAFCGTEDITVVADRLQNIVGNSCQIGLMEVDQATGFVLLNPNLAGEPTNKAVMEFGQGGNNNWTQLRTIGDSSPVEASVTSGSMPVPITEFYMSVRAEDVHLQSSAIDSAAAKTGQTLRISSQCPNDTKLYKFVIRARNIGTPASATTVNLSRVLVQNHQAQAVQITEGPGDSTGSRGFGVNIASTGVTQPVNGTVSTYPLTMANAVESVTPLAASGVFTGAVKTASSSVFRLFAHGIADQAGTLYLDIINSGTPVGPIASVPFTQVQGSTFYAGQLDVQLVPAVQYRLRYVNNATAQTTFVLVSRQGA